MTQLWAIQTVKNEDFVPLVTAFRDLGLAWAAFPVHPPSQYLPDDRWPGRVIYYGSTALVQKVWSDPDLAGGARLFYAPGNFAPSYYSKILKGEWLNHGAEFLTVGDVFSRYPSEEEFFVRPDGSFKTFTGQTGSLRYIRDLLDRFRQAGQLTMDSPVVLGKPIEIDREYRTWVVGDEIAAIVGYKRDGKCIPWVPFERERAEIYRYAEEQGRKLSELEAFVLDVAVLPDGDLQVIEINCIHSSGFYHHEIVIDVVAELSNYVAKMGEG